MTFSIDDSLARAIVTLAHEPTAKYIVRPNPKGALIWQCVLPSELCVTVNVGFRAGQWARAKNKKRLLQMMFAQHGMRVRPEPLPGRPHVHCVRFTSKRPDRQTGWAKDVVDNLLTPKTTRLKGGKARQRVGLGFIEDDSDEHINLSCWWEPAPPKKGFVLLRVYGGEE